jgi:hypothetical protein
MANQNVGRIAELPTIEQLDWLIGSQTFPSAFQ